MEPWIFMVEQTFQLCREISAFRKQLATWHIGSVIAGYSLNVPLSLVSWDLTNVGPTKSLTF